MNARPTKQKILTILVYECAAKYRAGKKKEKKKESTGGRGRPDAALVSNTGLAKIRKGS